MKRTIFQTEDKTYRILEVVDDCYSLEDLKGDCFNPKYVDHISPEELKTEELKFESQVNDHGVFGYILEVWDPTPGQGYQHLDSCFGFIGQYSETDSNFNHYIVNEFKSLITQERGA